MVLSQPHLTRTPGFSVEVSNSSGAYWKVMFFGATLYHATWNPTSAFCGLPVGSHFLVRVNVADGMYSASDVSDAEFTVLPAPTEPPAPPYELYTVIVVAVAVIVILLATCLLKRRQTSPK